VSLHSHTLHSKESLNFITHASRKSALLRLVLQRGEARYRRIHGKDLDLNRGWWTPPLAPLDAFRVEKTQLEEMDLQALVSLTDHDDIEAGMSLQALDASCNVPISVEWTVPFGSTFFHLGIHNILPQQARLMMQHLEAFTAQPELPRLRELLEELDCNPATLIVFNHPLWDEKGIGAVEHLRTAEQFLRGYGQFIHALELNGLRPWSENKAVIPFAEQWAKPVISGGDRHAVEPNATINITAAGTFSEFVNEVRKDGVSHVVMMPQYREGHTSRLFHNMLDVFRTYDDHHRGWVDWGDRVFFTLECGSVRSLVQIWGEKPPLVVALFAGFMRFAGHVPVRTMMRVATGQNPLSLL
jgi:hypothetical protein